MTTFLNIDYEQLIETSIYDRYRRLQYHRFFFRSMQLAFLVFFMLLLYLFQQRTPGQTAFPKENDRNTHSSHAKYPCHPSIWTIGMLNQHSKQSLCDNMKTTLAHQMFWNELLFEEQIWVIDNDENSIRRAQTDYQYSYPFPKFDVLNPSIEDIERMKRINAHTGMRTFEYELQQWRTFYLDIHARNIAKKYSIAPPEILGIVDGDAQFQTFPTLESVFPEIPFDDLISSNRSMNQHMKTFKVRAFGLDMDMFALATELFLGKPQVANFMVTFPVYVYLDTFSNLRHYIEKLHNMSFDQAFESIMRKVPTYYSQFAIILTYAYWFERERYSFHIQPWTDKISNRVANLTIDLIPQVRVSLHIKSHPGQSIMKGCCFSYQLKDTIMNMSLPDLFAPINRTYIKHLCDSFGDYENHFEPTSEYAPYVTASNMHTWKDNDTMTKHYQRVRRDVQYLSDQSRNQKVMACLNYLNDPNPLLWFPTC